ncbi:MAG: N-acetylmuramoyl-L-alanine amidase [Mycobacteriales bacterium]
MRTPTRGTGLLAAFAAFLAATASLAATANPAGATATSTPTTLSTAINRAAAATGVPAPLLTALCYLEGRLSDHGGAPSVDGGYGCMHLVRNTRADTLDQAARLLHLPAATVRTDPAANIRGGAAVLRAEAVRLSPAHRPPAALAGWYGAVAAYSHATARGVATMYADAVYRLLATGFTATAPTGETVRLAPRHVTPDRATAAAVTTAATLPAGCRDDGAVEYAGAIDCILDPATYDCDVTSPCTYQSANRPNDLAIRLVTIHDIEGTAQDALNVFFDPTSGVSIHYIVDSDGTVYQVLHEREIAYQAGNFWYNQHGVGIEHAGVDATGYQWYNATEYLSSARLTAHLLTRYGIPLDHAHVMSHGTTPSPTLGTTPNHVDPGPYWLWDYYLDLIHQQGVPYPAGTGPAGVYTLRPSTDISPFGANGTETQANFNFFTLYTGPSTTSAKIPGKDAAGDVTGETTNVEPALSFYALGHQPDSAGSGLEMYHVWYGEQATSSSQTATGTLAWLAVPPSAAVAGQGRILTLAGAATKKRNVYGRPTTSNSYVIGTTPGGSAYVTTWTVTEDGASTLWYAIDFNHRQAWIPASEVGSLTG